MQSESVEKQSLSYEHPESGMGKALAENPQAVEVEERSKWLIDRITALKGAVEDWDGYAFLLDQYKETQGLDSNSAKKLLEEYTASLHQLRTSEAGKADDKAHEAHIH